MQQIAVDFRAGMIKSGYAAAHVAGVGGGAFRLDRQIAGNVDPFDKIVRSLNAPLAE